VIGHEISHGFDDQGSKYDGDGNLENWWTEEDQAAFTRLTQKLVAQFAGYEPLPGKRINGELTLGENIADLSGMSIALKAYRLSLGGKPAPVLDQWTGDQRFFIGWSQIWRRKYRDAEMVQRLLTDPHSPSRYRANGPVSNLDEFYEAFGIKEGDSLYKPAAERIRIW
jgi:predicted metalloendopeptidase